MIVPIAYGVAVAAILLLFRHVARRYRTCPKRIPLGIGLDGRPRSGGSKRWLWVPPIVMAAVIALLGVLLAIEPVRQDQQVTIALVLVILAEVAGFAAWSVDRQIELARGMTFRIAPSRTLLAFFPVLATIGIMLFLILKPS